MWNGLDPFPQKDLVLSTSEYILETYFVKIAKPYIGATRTHFHTLCCYVRLCSQVDTPSSPRRGRARSDDTVDSCHWCIQDVDSCRLSRTLEVTKIDLSTLINFRTCSKNIQAYVPLTQAIKGHHLIVVHMQLNCVAFDKCVVLQFSITNNIVCAGMFYWNYHNYHYHHHRCSGSKTKIREGGSPRLVYAQ